MKITTEDGQEFELRPIETIISGTYLRDCYALKPVKKTEKKEYRIIFSVEGRGEAHLIDEEYKFTPTTADKLSEAISALVEYVQDPRETTAVSEEDSLMYKITEAWKSFQESQ